MEWLKALSSTPSTEKKKNIPNTKWSWRSGSSGRVPESLSSQPNNPPKQQTNKRNISPFILKYFLMPQPKQS
jgi:hypothetical protein